MLNYKIMAAAAAVALTAGATAANANTRLLVNCFFPPQHVICAEILPEWKRQVEEVTDRRVRIAIPATSMAPPPEQMASVRSGIFDAALQFNGFIQNEVVGTAVSMTPFSSGRDSEANSVALWRTYDTFLSEMDEYEGVELLGLMVFSSADFYSMGDQPIDSMEQLTGRKMWALPGVTAELIKNADGSVVSGPAVQMTEIVQRGVVDGFVGIPPYEVNAFNLAPYTVSVTRTPRTIFTPTFSFVINEDKWAEISAEDQAAIESVSGEAFSGMAGRAFNGVDGAAFEAENAGDIATFDASEEFYNDLVAASEPLTARWVERANAKGIDGQAALDFYRAQVDELSNR